MHERVYAPNVTVERYRTIHTCSYTVIKKNLYDYSKIVLRRENVRITSVAQRCNISKFPEQIVEEFIICIWLLVYHEILWKENDRATQLGELFHGFLWIGISETFFCLHKFINSIML